ncbi:response regulator transcription factor [Actinoplanes aureus]|uniref:response regulator transcription factor n=1 Tax=Actinoplanes aureus TaxID=2792083 RepID=UPI002814E252|nr:response regulator transcription factor [Actinoplanes aureus]
MRSTPAWDTPPRLLVVDDEDTVRGLLADALRFAGFTVTAVGTGADAVEAALGDPPDLIVLDLMLPGMDGFEVVRRLRSARAHRPVPVLFLSARDAPEDKVNGLSLGGDDYVTKPFHLPELIARIQAILRRSGAVPVDGVLAVADLTVDPVAREVTRAGRPVRLSPTEFKLLHFLVAHADQVVSKPRILEDVWRYDFAGDTSIVDTYVSYLRRKVDNVEPKLIHTVRGAGYVLRGPRR